MVMDLVHVGGGANSKQDVGLGVVDATTLTSDAIWRLRFRQPGTLPSGTLKLYIWSIANASSGVLKVNPKWASVATTESPSAATLQAEGTSTITFVSADAYVQTVITLDADTPVANESIVMDLTFEDSGTTVAVNSTHQVWIQWE
jgi:hypothetical protein